MNLNDNDYELIARRLDGEDVVLTEAQQALADEISADAEAVGMAMDIDLPGGTLHRINARMRKDRNEPKPARMWLRWTGAAAAVAAAVIVAAVIMLPEPKTPITPTPPAQQPVNGEQFVYDTITDDDLDFRVEAFSDELDDARTALLMNDDFSDELAMASMEQDMEELLLDDNGPETWIEQYNLEGPL